MLETNYMQLSEFNSALTAKDARIKEQLACLYPHAHSLSHTPSTLPDLSRQEDIVPPVRSTRSRRGNSGCLYSLRCALMIAFLPCKGQLSEIIGTRMNS